MSKKHRAGQGMLNIRAIRLVCYVFGGFILFNQAYGEDLTLEIIAKNLRKNSESFRSISNSSVGTSTSFEIDLEAGSTKIENKHEFNGFRFKVPKDAKGADFLWYFNVPSCWANWYILPISGAIKGGFTDWLCADKVYQNYDRAGAKDRVRVLQTLNSDYFQQGQEYLIWFRKVAEGKAADLKSVVSFRKKEDDWDFDKIETALGLKPQGAKEQVVALHSRGGEVLLDKQFFALSYAEERIDSVFFNIRNTKAMEGGLFITMEIAVPPCKTHPLLREIAKKYGVADFVRSSEEEEKVLSHSDGSPHEKGKNTVTYYYDYFGFEVPSGDSENRVSRVVTYGINFSDIKSVDEKPHFSQLSMKNLTVFHANRAEVGRLYFFLEGAKKPLVIREPPSGRYKREDETLECLGSGKWTWKSYYPNGKLSRSVPFEKNLMNGMTQGYYENGNKAFVASYKDGELLGWVIQYSEGGKETNRVMYENGQEKRANSSAEQKGASDKK